jgi:hypothetical protein
MGGASALQGEGKLVNLFFVATQGASPGDTLAVDFSSFTFNQGIPFVSTEGGILRVGTALGDVSQNGHIQAFDAALIFQYLLSYIDFIPVQTIVADVSGDTLVTEFDASLILQYVVALIDSFPQEMVQAVGFNATGALIVDNVIVRPGETLTIPIGLNNPEGILSSSLTLNFDPAVLTLVELGATHLSKGFMMDYQEVDGSLRILLAGTEPIDKEGSLVNVTFHVAETAEKGSPISLTDIRFNEEMIISQGASAKVALESESLGVDPFADNIPEEYSLAQNYPNPFNPETVIRLGLPDQSIVRLTIYDLYGRQVRELLAGGLSPGYHEITWDGTDDVGRQLSSGLYLYRLVARGDVSPERNTFAQTRKLVLLH